MAIVFGAIVPHPPLLVPVIGGKRIGEVERTRSAMEKIAKDLKLKEVDVIIIFTPHGAVSQVSLPVYTAHVFDGNFAGFGFARPRFAFKGEAALALQVVKTFEEANRPVSRISETLLDHGVMIPLYYLHEAGVDKPILPIAVVFRPLKELFEIGKLVASACEKNGKKIAVIGSADMSHRLTREAPSGFHPRGKEFDDKLVELVKKHAVEEIINFDPGLADDAGQDALWSIALLLGMLDGKDLKPEVFSYEGPFGVGYMVAEYA
jgi:aromatic ring-opening dioxygenase LigB subunit